MEALLEKERVKHGLASKRGSVIAKALCDNPMDFMSKIASTVYDSLYHVVYNRRKQNDMVNNEYGGIDGEHDDVQRRCQISEEKLLRFLGGWEALSFNAYLNNTLGIQEAFVQTR